MSSLLVRSGTAADIAAVVALERRTPEAPHWPERDYAAIAASTSASGAIRRTLLVAERDGRLIGFAVARALAISHEGELESVAVDDGARRLGAGRALCESVVGWCRAEGATAIDLEVRSASEGPIALYASLGFLPAGRRRAYYSDPVDDALLMRLELAEGG